MSDKPLVLVDGSSYLYRAFHALPPLTNSKGMPTGAVKGVISMIRKLVKDYPGSVVAVVFDAPGKTFREAIYPEYKANRPPMPDDLRAQVEPVHAIIKAMGLPLLVVPEVEADDVIGTLAHEAERAGQHVVISTGDKDLAQLVTPQVTLVNTMTNTVLDEAGVKEKFGIEPALFIDYLALIGDKTDNIPGVPGIGEKTALALLQGVGGLDALYAAPEAIAALDVRGAAKLPEKLKNEREKAYLSRDLATIRLDLKLPMHVPDLHDANPDKAALLELFRTLEFRTWVTELESGAADGEGDQAPPAPAPAAVERRYETVLDEERFMTWVERLKRATVFAFDTETTSLDYMQARVVGVSFAIEPGEAAYVPFAHIYPGAPDQLSEATVLGALKPVLEDASKAKVGQHLKYDRNVLANHGITLRGIARDTMLESYVLDSTATRHDMDSLAKKYLDENTIAFEDIAGKGARQITFDQVALEQAGPYAAEDADITLRLDRTLHAQLQQTPALLSVFNDIEMPLVEVLSDMEQAGTLIDVQQLKQQSQQLAERMLALENDAYQLAGGPFNLGSPKQLGEILFDRLQLPVKQKTPKGQPSTAEPVLAELAEEYELPRVIMEYRSMAKLKSTYTDKLPEMANPRTGRVHTSYHQAVTATGRLSSSDPNLQNIPVRTEEGRRIRKAFVAPKGHVLLAADYSQIELRIMAHLSGDAALLKAFSAGEDVHRATAAEVFGVAPEKVTADQRRSAKAINFGLIYGMSAFGLAKQLDVSRTEAQQYMDVYFARYPGVQRYMDDIRDNAKKAGYVETLFGRRLYLPEINARNPMQRQAAERTAINAPMQGTAADIIKRAMISIHGWLKESGLPARMVMQVHDELVLEVAESALADVREGVIARMRDAAQLKVPLLVEAGVGLDWDEAH
ncbi:MAG: DNA polymerase I [Gammaproteobacteria bacterium]|nr:MAG: DNA polymerase I [Gammaproteobacteria bacterium]